MRTKTGFLCYRYLLATALIAGATFTACSNNNTAPIAPPSRPSPTPTPVLTPAPTPSPVPSPAVTTEPVLTGYPNYFITVDGYGGGLEFPKGSTPSTDSITLTTQVTAPAGYPTTIPSGQTGAGSTAVAPWLSFQLAQALTLSGSFQVLVCGPFATSGTYYIALFDVSGSSPVFEDSTSVPSSLLQPCTSSELKLGGGRGFGPATRRIAPMASSSTLSTDVYYLGTFQAGS